ncbi:MAG: bifunctional glutamate N-acetyltransferase/amino-acid acetyltransferase ArgJ [Endomicrobiaceae bacterium]|nr:bifunctional glutamate N-acetyltransferase/amino-acid acetyltransferase ArgJ [Endomicrobiaceae bacterium]MDD3922747.1 bifunctional glutamate N-acetyltransferase/amino-acid acetyltransferase ArgJ [Endomicrobiaceae bacterium]
MLPKGFSCNGMHSGIAKDKNKKDLALFFSSSPATVAGMFTGSLVKAAPVLVDMSKLKKYKDFQAIIANSGCANACTGQRGKKDAEHISKETANNLNISTNSVLVASTGVIGNFLPVDKMVKALPALIKIISKKDEKSAVGSIMTTDSFAKIASKKIKVAKGEIIVWGCAKGAGMIHPDLKGLHATMLSFILTDAQIEQKQLQKITDTAIQQSFNCISVDGDTSTNDTVLVMANGQSNTGKLSKQDTDNFQEAINEVTLKLAKMIAKDGEGATKMIEISVINTKKHEDAEKIASTIATSPLVKTAFFGSDANWGRILAAIGRSGININPDKVDIYIGNIITAKDGMAIEFNEKKAKALLNKKECKITIDLKSGKQWARYYTCDFSYDYVKVNGSYRS